MPATVTASAFDIRNFKERLTPAKGRNRYYCPVCEGDNLTFDAENYQGYKCWNDDSDQHRSEIKEALSPWSAEKQQGSRGTLPAFSRQPRTQSALPVSLPQKPLKLARLPVLATDMPQPQSRSDKERGKVQITTYRYSDTQWVERVQWDDANNPKGHSKDFLPWHMGTNGKPVCKKGEADWLPYRWDEAIAAVKSSEANALLVVEGEGCVEAYRALGFAAITLLGSGWGKTALDIFAQQIKPYGLTLVFHPDHDTTGAKKAAQLSRACKQRRIPYLMLEPLSLCADLPEAGDVVDALKRLQADDYIQQLEAELHAAIARQQQDAQNQSGQEPVEEAPIKSTAMAAKLADAYRDRLAWNDERQSWYCYEADEPGVWSAETNDSVGTTMLAEIESRLGLQYTLKYLQDVVKLLKHRLLIRKWEEPQGLLPFRNGVLQLETGVFSLHAPGYRFTYAIPRDHNPLATNWGTIGAWLNEATGHTEQLNNILLCWLNACLKGRFDLQRFLYLVGPSGTGKGTFARLTINLIGDQNHHASSLQEWCGNRFDSANAYKKRLVVLADEDKYVGGLGNFKKLTGGDALRGEFKHKTAFHYTYKGMVMAVSNYPIFAGDSSSGIARRMLMVPFNHVIPPERRRNLEVEFEPELAALTNYVLAIPDAVVTQTLRESVNQAPDVIATTWEYRMRTDSVAAWLNECLIPDSRASERIGADKADATTLFGSYVQYCGRTGSRAKGSREFSPALLDLVKHTLHWGVDKKRLTAGFVIQGLRLRSATDIAHPYCLEALAAPVGLNHSVGSLAGSEALSREASVGSVESINSFGTKEKAACAAKPFGDVATLAEEGGATPYRPYRSVAEQALAACIPTLQMEDGRPYIQPKLLSPERLTWVLQALRRIYLLSDSELSHAHPVKRSETQRLQLLAMNSVQEPEVALEKQAPVTQETAQPRPQAKWVYVQLSPHSGETMVEVLSEKVNSLTVHVPGLGRRHIKASDVLRVADYTGT